MSTIKVLYYTDKKIYYLTPLVTQVTTSGDVTQDSRSCQVTLTNTLDGNTQAVNVELGKEIRFYEDDAEVFRGVIFQTEIKDTGELTITANDYNHYLAKNTDSIVFKKMKASQIVKSICNKFGIAYGTIDDTGYVFSKLILRDKTLYDMITIALTETKKKTGRVFILGNEQGKLTLRERKTQVKRLIISDGSNLMSASYSQSIEDLRNSVRITGKSGEDAKGVTVSDSDSIAKYGLMREKQDQSDNTDTQNIPVAKQLLKELNKVTTESNVDALGDSSIIAGKQVVVTEKMTGLSGGFYVITDSHTYSMSGNHTMSLKVSKTLDLNEIEYEPPDDTTSSSSTKSTSSSASYGVPKDDGGMFMKPTSAPLVSGYSSKQRGNLYQATGDVPIVASASGTVIRSGRDDTYGEHIIIQHTINGKKYETLYAYLKTNSRKYRTGKSVKRGAIIGYMGSTGKATKESLYFELSTPKWTPSHSNAINPSKYL